MSSYKKYASEEYVEERIANHNHGESTGGVSQEYVDEQIANHTHEEYATIEHMQSIDKGGTGQTSIEDTTYTTARYRASSIHSSTTTPSTNGVIAWTYE